MAAERLFAKRQFDKVYSNEQFEPFIRLIAAYHLDLEKGNQLYTKFQKEMTILQFKDLCLWLLKLQQHQRAKQLLMEWSGSFEIDRGFGSVAIEIMAANGDNANAIREYLQAHSADAALFEDQLNSLDTKIIKSSPSNLTVNDEGETHVNSPRNNPISTKFTMKYIIRLGNKFQNEIIGSGFMLGALIVFWYLKKNGWSWLVARIKQTLQMGTATF